LTLLIAFSFLLVLLLPGEALAWGPGVHTAAARFVLANLDLVPLSVASLITQFPNTYLYGCLSADFFVGKGTKGRPGHSHNWDSALRLTDSAHSPQLMAHALGYMSHLAADVVAHNYYVPDVMARTAMPGNLAHVYVEMQADSHLTGGHALKGRLSRPAQRMVDRSLVAALDKNPLSYLCRKRVFGGSVRLSRLRGWNRSLRFAQRLLPLPNGEKPVETMFELSLRAVLDVLHSPEDSILRDFDPIGSVNLARAKRKRAASVDERLLGLPALPLLVFQEVA
jgi:hypothetical protein